MARPVATEDRLACNAVPGTKLMLLALLIIVSLAIEMVGNAGPFLPGLGASLVLGGYLAVAPPVFASRTRASTAEGAGGWLVLALAGYAVLWSIVVAAL